LFAFDLAATSVALPAGMLSLVVVIGLLCFCFLLSHWYCPSPGCSFHNMLLLTLIFCHCPIFFVAKGFVFVEAELHPCLSRLRQRCFEIAVDNIANRDENSCFAWYERRDSQIVIAPAAPPVGDGMLSPSFAFLRC
jgi:hypothetical protein